MRTKMSKVLKASSAAFMSVMLVSSAGWGAGNSGFGEELIAIQRAWAAAKYQAPDKKARKAAFEALVERTAAFRESYPGQAEALAWEGIALSTYAGEVGGMSALKHAKAAREALHRAEALEPTALGGGIYASLGALYSKVPGGFIGFGDDGLAEEYFKKALAVDPAGMDSNFFYGEFLLEQGDYDDALEVLERALKALPSEDRPIFEAGRRAEIRALIAEAAADDGG